LALVPPLLAGLLARPAPAGEGPGCLGEKATVVGTQRADVLVGSPHHDVIVSVAGNDRIMARGGTDFVCAGSGNDLIKAGEGVDIVFGGDGDDRIDVGPKTSDPDLAPEEVTGGRGNDTILEAQLLYVIAAPGPGDDTIRSGSNGILSLDLSTSERGLVVDLTHGIAIGEGRDTLSGVTSVLGSRFDDVMVGNDERDFLAGNGGSDRILGGSGQDVLDGAAGVVEGLRAPTFWPSRDRGDNVLEGGPGNDHISGGGGDETFIGGAGKDLLVMTGAQQGVTVDLEAGFSRGDGSDTISGIESIIGTKFPDWLLGDDGPNRIEGSPVDPEDDDHIEGRGGDDHLFGSRGDDSLLGGEGRDRIDGSFGRDHCFGGEDIVGCEVTTRSETSAFPSLLITVGIVGLGAIAAVVVGVRMRR
jgi:Ca2+-binding RTX toxin-like protein